MTLLNSNSICLKESKPQPFSLKNHSSWTGYRPDCLLDRLQARLLIGQATGHTASWTGYRPYRANCLEYFSAMALSATDFQFVLDLAKRWWLDGFAACTVNGQLAIAYPLYSHTHYIAAYVAKSWFARAWPTVHPVGWHRMQHEDRVEAQRAGRTHYHFLVAQEDPMAIETIRRL